MNEPVAKPAPYAQTRIREPAGDRTIGETFSVGGVGSDIVVPGIFGWRAHSGRASQGRVGRAANPQGSESGSGIARFDGRPLISPRDLRRNDVIAVRGCPIDRDGRDAVFVLLAVFSTWFEMQPSHPLRTLATPELPTWEVTQARSRRGASRAIRQTTAAHRSPRNPKARRYVARRSSCCRRPILVVDVVSLESNPISRHRASAARIEDSTPLTPRCTWAPGCSSVPGGHVVRASVRVT